MTITEFLEARIAEDEEVARECLTHQPNGPWMDSLHDLTFDYDHFARWNPDRVLPECAAKRAIVKQHEDWPVLVEKKPEFSEDATDLQSMAYRVSQEMIWLTEREYVKRFGVEAPTTNMVRALAAVYKDHPDYQPEWDL